MYTRRACIHVYHVYTYTRSAAMQVDENNLIRPRAHKQVTLLAVFKKVTKFLAFCFLPVFGGLLIY